MTDVAQRAQARDSRKEHHSSPLGLNGSSRHAGRVSSGDAEGSVFKRREQVCEDTEQQRAWWQLPYAAFAANTTPGMVFYCLSQCFMCWRVSSSLYPNT